MNNQLAISTDYGYMICISFTNIKVVKIDGKNKMMDFYNDDEFLFCVSSILNKLKFNFEHNKCRFYDLVKK